MGSIFSAQKGPKMAKNVEAKLSGPETIKKMKRSKKKKLKEGNTTRTEEKLHATKDKGIRKSKRARKPSSRLIHYEYKSVNSATTGSLEVTK